MAGGQQCPGNDTTNLACDPGDRECLTFCVCFHFSAPDLIDEPNKSEINMALSTRKPLRRWLRFVNRIG
jgi:hypothetical protein